MKRYIKSASEQVIFEDEFFSFVRTSGRGMNNTFWRGLEVLSKGLAKKHVVEIRLQSYGNPKFDGSPVIYDYRGVYVAQGSRSVINTLDETKEVIEVLEDAVDFAEHILDWLRDNDYSVDDLKV